jgi:hypothetical protein
MEASATVYGSVSYSWDAVGTPIEKALVSFLE